jgi:predicted nucleotidyltransferase
MTAIESAIKELSDRDIDVVLIGGMAVVLLGSTRTTKDFDFAIDNAPEVRRQATEALYEAGFQLITRVGKDGIPIRTLDNLVIARNRVLDQEMHSAFFWHHGEERRIDLVFRLSLKLADLLRRGEEIQLGHVRVRRAAPKDLIKLKKAALRDDPTRVQDKQDLVYLEHLLSHGSRKGG